MQLQKLNSTHQLVLRHLALGTASLEDICAKFNLNLCTFKQVVSCELFKVELEKLREELKEAQLQQALEDPVMAELRKSALGAAHRLSMEVNNTAEELGATSATRIKASESILDRLGYSATRPKEDGNAQPTVIINISQGKLNSILRRAGKAPAESTLELAPT